MVGIKITVKWNIQNVYGVKEEPTIQSNPGCGAVSQSVQGLLFNDKCKGKKDYKAEPFEKSYKTICMFRKE